MQKLVGAAALSLMALGFVNGLVTARADLKQKCEPQHQLIELGRLESKAPSEDSSSLFMCPPKTAVIEFKKALLAARFGNYDLALIQSHRSIALDPYYQLPYVLRSELYLKAKLPYLALADIARARELDPEDPHAEILHQNIRQVLGYSDHLDLDPLRGPASQRVDQ